MDSIGPTVSFGTTAISPASTFRAAITTVDFGPPNDTEDEQFWEYGERGRLSKLYGLGFSEDAAESRACTYNLASGQKTRDHLLPVLGEPISDGYAYRTDGRLEKAGDEEHTYTSAGNLKTVQDLGVKRQFTYGAKNRLKKMVVGENTTYYNWDSENGRRLAQGPNEIDHFDPEHPGQPTLYTYNQAGELVAYQDFSDPDNKVSATYAYDAEGQRIRAAVHTHYGDPDKGRLTTSQYLYDGLNLLSVRSERIRTDSGALAARWQITYLYDAGGRPYAGLYHDLKTTDPQEGTPKVFLIISNQRGDVIELLNANHSAIVAYRYDAWGVPRATEVAPGSELGDALASRNLLRYAGYAYDDYSGMYYLQRRYYDTVTRSFISRDPGRADGLESPYQYCGGRPVAMVDPSGEMMVQGSGINYGQHERAHPRVRNPLCVDPYAGYTDPLGVWWFAHQAEFHWIDDEITYGPPGHLFHLWLEQNHPRANAGFEVTVNAAWLFVPVGGELKAPFSGWKVYEAGRAGCTAWRAERDIKAAGSAWKAARAADAGVDAAQGVQLARRMAAARTMGTEGELAAGIAKNTQRIPVGASRYRIPDGLDPFTLSEVKNVQQLSYTSQLRDYNAYAQLTGRRFDFYVRPDTRFSGPLRREVESGAINLEFLR